MKEEDIIKAYCRIRTIDHTIPDDVLDFMKQAAIEKINQISDIDTLLAETHKITRYRAIEIIHNSLNDKISIKEFANTCTRDIMNIKQPIVK